jgi:hypothetical protein
MTVEDLVVETFEVLGEPSDLEIYTGGVVDIAQPGTIKILKWINRAYKRIINWKFPNGSQVRFNVQSGEAYFSTKVLTGTASAGTSTTITLDGLIAEADRYNGWLVEITGGTGAGQKRLIVDFYSSLLATVSHAWDVTPNATSVYALYKRRYWFREPTALDIIDNIEISPVNQIATVLKLSCPEDSEDLPQGSRTETYMTDTLNSGDPSSYIPLGDSILFDIAPDTVKWYRLEYSKIPDELTTLTQEPMIPASFHEALLLYTHWIGLRRSQEWGGAYSTKRDIEDLMSSLKTSLEQAFEREYIGASF